MISPSKKEKFSAGIRLIGAFVSLQGGLDGHDQHIYAGAFLTDADTHKHTLS